MSRPEDPAPGANRDEVPRRPERALVIVPTYNERENIARLIETVLSQDRRLEILVVDDGSPDGTAAIVEQVMAENRRVPLVKRSRKMGMGSEYLGGVCWGRYSGFAF